jgi:hypothetical protein
MVGSGRGKGPTDPSVPIETGEAREALTGEVEATQANQRFQSKQQKQENRRKQAIHRAETIQP